MLATDVIQQVAEAKCPACFGKGFTVVYPGTPEKPSNKCPDCRGTGLRWPELSRECHEDYSEPDFEEGHTHGRVPDVTLEKVLPLIYSLEKASPADYILGRAERAYTGLWAVGHSYYADKSKQMTYYEATPLEAACAALMAT